MARILPLCGPRPPQLPFSSQPVTVCSETSRELTAHNLVLQL